MWASLILLAAVPFALPFITLSLPFIMPMPSFFRLSLSFLTSQLIFAFPLVPRLLGHSNLAHQAATLAIVIATYSAIPASMLQLYIIALATLTPLTSFVSSVILVAASVKISRYWSLQIYEHEKQGDTGMANRYKALILATSSICIVASLRWLYLAFADEVAFTVGHAVELVSFICLMSFLVINCLQARRGVLSEVAVVIMIASYALYAFHHQSNVVTAASLTESPFASLDEWFGVALDGAALALFAADLIIDWDQDYDENESGTTSTSYTSSIAHMKTTSFSLASLTSSLSTPMLRSIAVILLTHYFQNRVDVSMAAQIQSLPQLIWRTLNQKLALESLFASLSVMMMNGSEATVEPGSLTTLLHGALEKLATILTPSLGCVVRGLTVVVYYIMILRRDRSEEE